MIQIIAIGFVAVFLLIIVITLISRYRMCPPDRILVVYGKLATGQSSICYHGGSTFVMPFFQSYGYLDLTPINIEIELKGALSSQNIRIDAPASFTIGISTEPEVMQNAATRLLGRTLDEIQQLASEIIMGQMRVVFASMSIEEINTDREKLIALITKGVEVELHKVGLRMINGNIRDIKDHSGYIDALGKEAAAKAINDAQIRVAQENQRGAVGKAEAEREQAIRVANAEAEARKGRTPPRWLSPSPMPIWRWNRPKPSVAPRPHRRSPRPAPCRSHTRPSRRRNSPVRPAKRRNSRPIRS